MSERLRDQRVKRTIEGIQHNTLIHFVREGITKIIFTIREGAFEIVIGEFGDVYQWSTKGLSRGYADLLFHYIMCGEEV